MKNLTTITFLMALLSVFLAIPVLQAASADADVIGQAEVTPPSSTPPSAAAPSAPAAPDRPAAALGTGETTPPQAPEDAVKTVVTSVRSGNWKLAVAAILSLLMTLLGKFRGMIPIFRGDRGGSLLVMTLAVLGSLATALGTGGKIDVNLLLSAAGVAFTAVGGWTWFNQVARPADKQVPPAA